MASPSPTKPKSKAEQEAQQKAARRAEQANILAGARPLLEQDEQLLAFARARVAGGWRSKLNVGPEAFFAPFVNVALTERRFLVQHVHHTNGKPSEMLPHAYAFEKVARVQFTDIETYGGEPACRLILHLENGLYVRLRLRGQLNFESAKTMAKLFDSLTTAKRATPLSPTRSLCPQCDHVLDQPYKFCPYCGTQQPLRTSGSANAPTAGHTGITLATPDETPLGETGQEEEKKRRGEEETTPNGEGVHYSIPPTASISIPRETDFAYEREDRPAEFGFALPVPFSEPFAEEIPETTPDAESGEAYEAADAESVPGSDDGITATPISALEETPDTEDFSSLMEPMGESMFAPEEPVISHDTAEGAGAAFEQYDTQAFTELPFSSTADSPDDPDTALNSDLSEPMTEGEEGPVKENTVEENTVEENTVEENTEETKQETGEENSVQNPATQSQNQEAE